MNAFAERNRKAAYERRQREKGQTMYSLRLSAAARAQLNRIADTLGCCGRDVIEAFLLGTVNVEVVELMREHGLSESEAKAWIRMRDDKDLPRFELTGAEQSAMAGMA